jgi:hypothetical protein
MVLLPGLLVVEDSSWEQCAWWITIQAGKLQLVATMRRDGVPWQLGKLARGPSDRKMECIVLLYIDISYLWESYSQPFLQGTTSQVMPPLLFAPVLLMVSQESEVFSQLVKHRSFVGAGG